MPTYEHLCEECQHEWDQVYSMKEDPPTVCPNCETEGKVKRLISGGSGKGIVRLTGHERTAHIKSEARKFRREASQNENIMANIVGEEAYHAQKLAGEKLENELVKIGKDAPKKPQKTLNKGKIKRVSK